MTVEEKIRYEDDKSHYDLIREIVKEENKTMQISLNESINNVKWFIGLASGVMAFLFVTQFVVYKELSAKPNINEVVGKMQYYQMEEDEHRMLLELAPDVNKAIPVFEKINDNIARELGFRFTTKRDN